jgi:hypothetical protein
LAPPGRHGDKSSDPRLSGTRPLERQPLTSRRRRPASFSSRSPPTSWARPQPRLQPPPSRARAPTWHALAPPWLVPPLSQTAWWWAPLRPPQAMVLLPPEPALVTGVQAPTCRGEPAPYRLPPLPPLSRPMTSTPLSLARRVPAARAVGTPRSSAPGAPVAVRRTPSSDPLAPALAAVPRAQARGTEAWVAWTSRRSRAPSAGVERSLKTHRQPKKPAKQERKSRNLLTNWPTGSISSAHRDASSQCPGLRSMSRCARVAAYDHGKGSRSSRDSANATVSASSLISKMRSRLSIRGRSAGGGGWRGRVPRSAAVRQLLQRGHERVQPRLVRGRRHPVVPGGGPLLEHLAGVGGRPGSALRR